MTETGSTGNAGALEEGFSVVSRDTAIAGTNIGAEEEDEDDFFAVSVFNPPSPQKNKLQSKP